MEAKADNHIGEMLRLHREKIGLSVRTLATNAGFSPSFISQVENGVASPSIGSLEKIASCLDVSVSELFKRHDEPVSSVVRAKERPRVESGWSQAEIESLGFDKSTKLEPLLITLQPGGASGKRPQGVSREQFVFVVAGEVLLTLDGVDQSLTKGDAVTVRPNNLVLWVNTSDRPLQILFVSHAV